MAPLAAIWTQVLCFIDFFNGKVQPASILGDDSPQVPLLGSRPPVKYPIFDPPDELEPQAFRCEYPDYPERDGWVACNTNEDRKCWLKNTKTGQTFHISTDYEVEGPKGIVREYYLELSNSTRNPDGWGNVSVQLFNGSFPGPRLQACWGDQLRITINNTLLGSNTTSDPGNGTTVHWHGIRQWKTSGKDGVNAVTQCPIAPGQSFTYVFNVTQYGTSWYHSHYSLQYAAGALGPLTIYGPTSKDYDHSLSPIILSDWLHTSVYEKWDRSLIDSKRIFIDNMLQNGMGQWPPLDRTAPISENTKFNTVYFQKGARYMMRIINGAADTTFVFSIDNHSFWVISTDFVAIEPYLTNRIVVGIGQRYNIIVHAVPDDYTQDVSYWIRTSPSPNCTAFDTKLYPPAGMPDGRTGIVRYTQDTAFPTTTRQKFELTCADETYFRNLTPMVHWTVPEKRKVLPNFYLSFTSTATGSPYYPCAKKGLNRFQLVQDHPMWLNSSNPALLDGKQDFSVKPWLTVVDTGDVDEEAWIQVNIISGSKSKKSPTKPRPVPKVPGLYVPGQHPIHLHGHDFAVLDQCIPDDSTECDINNASYTRHNPPRRDVAFLPDNGYLIIAFKADNPGAWIMHCHIAFHASMGLATQILENVNKWPQTFGLGWDEPLLDMCKSWNAWNPDDPSDPCMNNHPLITPLQTDSGI